MKGRNRLVGGVLVLAAGSMMLLTSGCASEPAPATRPGNVTIQDSLYQHLGGHDGVARIADGWVDKVVADPVLKARFAATDVDRFKARMTALLCQVTGGPEVYTGKDMKTEHRGMNVSDGEWGAFVDDLKAVLDDMKVASIDREELLVKLEPMKAAIVGQ